MEKVRVVHYVNQFFGQMGGEDKADLPPLHQDKPVGVGALAQSLSGGRFEIVRTIICGDNWAAENLDEFSEQVLEMIREADPQLVIAGPAFFQGRHGVACAAVCKAVAQELDIPVITGMHPLNPGVEMARQQVHIVEAGENAREMKKVMDKMVELATKMLDGVALGLPHEEGYLPRNIRLNRRVDRRGSRRAVDMLKAKMTGQPFTTELPIPEFDRVPPAPAIKDITSALVAIGTDGGLVTRGNPDRLESHNASKWLHYSIAGLDTVASGDFECAHGGYDPVPVNEDPNRVLPLDAARLLEGEGAFGRLYDEYYTTTGNVTAVASAARYGREIGKAMAAEGVLGLILTST